MFDLRFFLNRYKFFLIFFLAMISISTAPIIARILNDVPAVIIGFWRMSVASLILWIYSFIKPVESLNTKNKNLTILAGIFLGVHFYYFFQAIKLTTIPNATFLGTLAPLFILLFEFFFLKRRLNKKIIIPLLIVFFGSIIIAGNQFNFKTENTLGNLAAIFCSFWLGITFLLSQKVRENTGTITFTRVLFLTASLTLLMISMLTGEHILGYTKLDYLGLIILGIVPTIIGHNTMYYAVKYLPPSTVSSIPLGEPILASVFAWVLFFEPITSSIIIGGSFTLIGLFYLGKESKPI